MGEKLYGADDILKKFRFLEKEINGLSCLLDKCCSKEPINIGGGVGLYSGFSGNKWQFKSLEAGSNITLTDNGSKITISSTGGGAVTCDDVKDCLGISNAGDPNKFLNEQGDWITVSPAFDCTDLLSCSTTNLPEGSNLYFTNERAQDAVGNILTNTATINLTYNDAGNTITADFASLLISQFTNDAGYITSTGASLTDTYVGYGSNTNTLTGSANFIYDVTNQIFDVKFGSPGVSYLKVDIPSQYAVIDNSVDKLELSLTTATLSLGGGNVISFDRPNSLYSIGANGFDFNTHILIDDTVGSKNIQLNSTNGVIVSNLATGGTEMVVADSTGLLSKQSIPTGGITTLNTLTATTQTFATGSAGTDFNISSSTSTHTFNIPTASASNRGLLSTTDWSTFNSKEPAITWSQGDILYGTGVNTYSHLAKNTSATRYLSNTGTSNNPAWAQIDLTNGVTSLLPSGNGGSDDWVDYSGTSTVTGWSSFTTKIILYRQSYKTIQVIFYLGGTSNSTATTFTLPTASSASSYLSLTYIAVNNGTVTSGCRYELPSSSSTVTCDPTSAGGTWLSVGSKIVRGEFFYKID